jgi:hypothetical protein
MAAGLGFKTFNTGDVLSAADVNGYLMQGILVFASATARDAAITSPEEGQFAFLKDTNVTTYYTGSAWANVDTTGMTNPMTTTGDVIYSSSGSTPARLGIGTAGQVLQVNSGATAPEWATPAAGTSSFVGALVTKSTSQSISNATAANLTWNLETFDTNGFHDNSTNNSRMTIPTGYGGKYAWSTTVGWGIASETGNKTIDIRKNNATIFYNEYEPAAEVDFINLSGIIELAATDYLEVRVRQTSGGAVNVQGDDYNNTTVSFFSITYLGA